MTKCSTFMTLFYISVRNFPCPYTFDKILLMDFIGLMTDSSDIFFILFSVFNSKYEHLKKEGAFSRHPHNAGFVGTV